MKPSSHPDVLLPLLHMLGLARTILMWCTYSGAALSTYSCKCILFHPVALEPAVYPRDKAETELRTYASLKQPLMTLKT